MARPHIEINWDDAEKLLGMQCTLRELDYWFQCSEDTIERAVKRKFKIGYAEWSGQKLTRGRISLRRKQFEVAMNGNVAMLIWLGKQYLGQADKIEEKVDVSSENVYKCSFGDIEIASEK